MPWVRNTESLALWRALVGSLGVSLVCACRFCGACRVGLCKPPPARLQVHMFTLAKPLGS